MELGDQNELEFTAASAVSQLGIKGAFFVMSFEPKEANLSKVASLLQETIKGVKTDSVNINDDPVLAGFRELHTTVGVSNRRHVSSPENKIALVLAGRDLPTINPIVDIYNIVSLRTKLALGAHDTHKLEGPIALRLTNGTESFTPLGSSERKPIGVGEYGYVDEGCNEVICRLETRQCEKTKVSASSSECFFVVEGNRNTDVSYIQQAVSQLQRLLVECCGGSETSKVYWLE